MFSTMQISQHSKEMWKLIKLEVDILNGGEFFTFALCAFKSEYMFRMFPHSAACLSISLFSIRSQHLVSSWVKIFFFFFSHKKQFIASNPLNHFVS